MRSLQGTLIAFEGIDGAGKSTLLRAVERACADRNLPISTTKQPGGTPLGKDIRTLFKKEYAMCPQAEFLLFAADRAQHMQYILPKLAAGHVVLSDRMADSSVAYQGYGRGLDIAFIKQVNAWVMPVQPDLIIYVDIPVELALKRIAQRNEQITIFEEDRHFLQRLHAGFAQMYANTHNVIRIDGTQHTDTVAHTTITQVFSWLLKNHRITA